MKNTKNINKPPHCRVFSLSALLFLCSLLPITYSLTSCSFDYGEQESEDDGLPDIVMDHVEYVRVRGADVLARFLAERVERFEDRGIMELRNFSFEQFGNRGEDVNAFGRAGSASFEIDTGDILMTNGVRIDVETEDIVIETDWLQWRDRERTLSSGSGDEVYIFQENGTVFTGTGFHANTRYRTWEFTGIVSGTYIHDEDEDDDDNEDDDEDESNGDDTYAANNGEAE